MEFRNLFKNMFHADSAEQQNITTQQLIPLNDYTQTFCRKLDYSNEILIKTCINCISKHISKLNANHVILNEKGKKTPIFDSKLHDLLTLEPNPQMTSIDMLYKLCAQTLTNQNGFIYIDRDSDGQVNALWNLDYMTLEPRELNNEVYIKFTFMSGTTRTIPYADLIHIRSNFQNGEFIAHSEDNLNDNLALLDTLKQSFANTVKNSGKIKGVAKISGQIGATNWQEKSKLFASNLKNPDNGGIVATDSSVDFIPCNNEPKSASHEEIDYLTKTIYNYYGVSREIIANKYTEEEWQAFFESTIEPFSIQLSQEFTRKIFTLEEREEGNQIVFDANRLTYSDTKTKIELIRQLRPLGILTTNQALEIMNLPPVENGDDRVQTLNVVNTDIVNDYQLDKLSKESLNSVGRPANINSGGEEDND